MWLSTNGCHDFHLRKSLNIFTYPCNVAGHFSKDARIDTVATVKAERTNSYQYFGVEHLIMLSQT